MGTERQIIEGGDGPIPWSKIYDYACADGLTADSYHRFKHIIRALDSEYLSIRSANRDKAREFNEKNKDENDDESAEKAASRVRSRMKAKYG